MKKIFVILSVLFIGLLVGCASKPSSKKDAYSFPTEEELINQKYNDFVEKFTFMMYEKPVLSVYELPTMLGYTRNSDFDSLSGDRPLVTTRQTNRKDFSMKITNATDKDVTFCFIAKTTCSSVQHCSRSANNITCRPLFYWLSTKHPL